MDKKFTTEYQLHVDSPDAEPCKKAAGALLKEITEKVGRGAISSVGIGLNSTSTAPAIRVYLVSKKHLKSIPETYRGFEVIVVVTGEIRAQ